MKIIREIAGYVLGGVMFVVLLPIIMFVQVLTEENAYVKISVNVR